MVNILTGPYMQSLSQYRNVGSRFLEGAVLVANAIGSSPATPPASFSNTDVSTLLTNLIFAQRFPDPSSDLELLYMAGGRRDR